VAVRQKTKKVYYIEALKSKHHDLKLAIDEHNSRPHPDDDHIHGLKKQKLQIKDEIEALSATG